MLSSSKRAKSEAEQIILARAKPRMELLSMTRERADSPAELGACRPQHLFSST